jgi:hypothetical protein
VNKNLVKDVGNRKNIMNSKTDTKLNKMKELILKKEWQKNIGDKEKEMNYNIELTKDEAVSLVYQLRPEAIKGEAPRLRRELRNLQGRLAKLLDRK